ncbi:MAG: hypothetical protein JJU13_19100 [Balneolaceae bacterium]|nr:hypothetical protein [Balneolaceae bacterium]
MKTLRINRKIESTNLHIEELNKWLGKEVDIIIKEKHPSASDSSDMSLFPAAGILTGYKNNDLIDREKSGWIKAIKEKHGNS